MNIKKILASVFAVAIVGSTAAVSAYAQSVSISETYKANYNYNVTAKAMDSPTDVLRLTGMQINSGMVVESIGTNLLTSEMYVDIGVSVYAKDGKELAYKADGKKCAGHSYAYAVCSDCQTNNNVYRYVHDSTMLGDVTVSSSRIASAKITVTIN